MECDEQMQHSVDPTSDQEIEADVIHCKYKLLYLSR